ncbi:hypothetical protein EVAR_5320_1 [Eumeta japonica]|uniref:Uncharacterized protein n=1 Tax=Eumeta variegata TaxID=151549 RepID=A0A4C1TN81_EUMVA|nr:hypothetical protein EVAR_5320_1 [Eumeta japonica]
MCGVSLKYTCRDSGQRAVCDLIEDVVTRVEEGTLRWFDHQVRRNESRQICTANTYDERIGEDRLRKYYADQIGGELKEELAKSMSYHGHYRVPKPLLQKKCTTNEKSKVNLPPPALSAGDALGTIDACRERKTAASLRCRCELVTVSAIPSSYNSSGNNNKQQQHNKEKIKYTNLEFVRVTLFPFAPNSISLPPKLVTSGTSPSAIVHSMGTRIRNWNVGSSI